MDDAVRLADLSHAVERVALALCRDDSNESRIGAYLAALADGEREVVTLALSYALRRRVVDGSSPVVDRAIVVLAETVRRLGLEARAG